MPSALSTDVASLRRPEALTFTPKALEAARTAFQHSGVVLLRGLLPGRTVARLRRITDILAEEPPSPEGLSANQSLWHRYPAIRDVHRISRVASTVGTVLGVDSLRLLYDEFLDKRSGAPETGWHQDMPYWPNIAGATASLWMALDPVDEMNGATRYFAGSHRLGRFVPQDVEPQRADESWRALWADKGLDSMPDLAQPAWCETCVHFELKPGDGVLHHAWTVHGAAPNQTKSSLRRAWITRWFDGRASVDASTSVIRLPPAVCRGKTERDRRFPMLWRATRQVRLRDYPCA